MSIKCIEMKNAMMYLKKKKNSNPDSIAAPFFKFMANHLLPRMQQR